ncbi:MAG: transglutaminase protein [Acidimicrobiales bacterium]|jgi:transglutaminase-like putative cysteine protease|nr:transglutaminase protein [Acidimicrobiales bacterium]
MIEALSNAIEALSNASEITAFTLQQRIRYDYTGPVTALRQRLVVVPPANHGSQRRWHWAVHVDGAVGATQRARRDRYGNLGVDIAVPKVDDWVEFRVECTVGRRARRAPYRISPDWRYLSPTRLTAPDDRIAALAARCRDPEAICARVHEHFRYEYGVTGVRTTAVEALRGGVGVCQDYAHVMLSACRSAGLPARYVSGHLVGEGGSHAWVEVLRPDPTRRNAWLVEAWDPTHDRRALEGYLTVAVGRDYADVAPMTGTYEGAGVDGALTVWKQLIPSGGQPALGAMDFSSR